MLAPVLVLVPLAAAAPMPAPAPVVEWLPLLVAAVLGALAARLLNRWERNRPVATVRLGRGNGYRPFPGLPGVGDGHSVWFVAAEDIPALLLALATRLSSRGPVLLLPHPDRRGELWAEIGPTSLAVWAPEAPRPTARAALTAAAGLATQGQVPVVLLDGTGALEPAPADRPDAAVRELLDAANVPVFVVLAEGEAAPGGRRRTTARVRRQGVEFVGEGRA